MRQRGQRVRWADNRVIVTAIECLQELAAIARACRNGLPEGICRHRLQALDEARQPPLPCRSQCANSGTPDASGHASDLNKPTDLLRALIVAEQAFGPHPTIGAEEADEKIHALRDIRWRPLLHRHATCAQRRCRRLGGAPDGWRSGEIPIIVIHRDTQARHIDLRMIRPGSRRDINIEHRLTRSGEDAQRQRDIGDAARQWSLLTDDGLLPDLAQIGRIIEVRQRPEVGFSVVKPQKCAGMRKLPPMSPPMPMGEPPAAMIAPSPPLLPPGVRARFQGLLARP